MPDYIVNGTDLTSVANAIRTAGGTSGSLSFPSGFVSAIGNLGGGSSDFSTATMTIIANEASSISFPIPCVYEAGELGEGSPAMIYDFFAIESQTGTFTRTIPLYKGSLMIENPFPTGEGLTGNIELLFDGAYALITGDFTYTEGSPDIE